MNSDMKLIMESWRKFSKKLESFDKSKVLIETKKYNGNLKNLLSERENKNISKNEFNKIIFESIEKDLNEADFYLNKLAVIRSNPLLAEQEGFLGKAKQFASSAITAIKNAFFKTFQVIKDAPFQVLFLKNKVETQIRQFAKENPQKAKLLGDVLKVAMAAAAVYALYKFSVGDAQAAVQVKSQLVQGDEMKGFEILEYLQTHASELNLSGKDLTQIKMAFQGEGDKTAALGKLSDIVNKAQDLMDASYQQAMQGGGSFDDVKPMLDAASDAAKQAADIAAAKAAGVASDAGGAAQSVAGVAAQKVSGAMDAVLDLTRNEGLGRLKQIVADIKKQNPNLSDISLGKTVLQDLLKKGQISQEQYTNFSNISGNVFTRLLGAIQQVKG